MINYGICSTARITKRFIEGIRCSAEGNVYAIASRSSDKAKKAAEDNNIDIYYGSYEELFSDENIDVIYVATTNSTHYQYAKEALNHHKHVIVEKPFTLTKAQAEELFELAERNGCFLMEDQKEVFLPVNKKVRELINSKEIGEVEFIEMMMSHPGNHPKGNWMYDINQGGGALYGSGAYPYELAAFLLDCTDFRYSGSFVQSEETADNIANVSMSNDKVIISFTTGMNVHLDNKAVIYGSKGKIEISHYWKADHFILTKDDNSEVFDFPYDSEFVYPVEHVNECIKVGKLTSDVITREITVSCVKMLEELISEYRLQIR